MKMKSTPPPAMNRHLMATCILGILSAMLIVGCDKADKDNDENERGASSTNPVTQEQPAPIQLAGKKISINFDKAKAGQPPPDFHSALTGGGSSVSWTVLSDASAPTAPNVLAQTSADRTDDRFPLAVFDGGSFKDMDISVRFKAVSGEVDRAGGLAFRLQNANNYYVVRANALEDNFNLYRVERGVRRQIAGTRVKVPSNSWHELRVHVSGNDISCYFDGGSRIQASDNTFKEPGKVGLWTKADSVTYFDDLEVVAH